MRWSSSTTSRPAIARRSRPAPTLRVATYVDRDGLARLLETERIEAILHCAARSQVGESIADPSKYYRENVAGGVALLEAARAAGIGRLVFSSTAAVYGIPDASPIPEDAPLRPINPYGETKRTFEGALDWYGRAYGLRSVSLRYFNVAGATAHPRRGPRPGDPPDPERPRGGRRDHRADHLRRRLSDARRDLHPRLHPRRGPGRRAPARPRGDRSRRPPHGRALALNLGNGGGLLDPRGPRRGRGRRRASDRVHGRPTPCGRPAGPRGERGTGRARSSAGGPRGRASRRWWAPPGSGGGRTPPAIGTDRRRHAPDMRGPSPTLYESPRGEGPMRYLRRLQSLRVGEAQKGHPPEIAATICRFRRSSVRMKSRPGFRVLSGARSARRRVTAARVGRPVPSSREGRSRRSRPSHRAPARPARGR